MVHFIEHWIGGFWLAYFAIWYLLALTAKRTVQRQAIGSRLLQWCLGFAGIVLIFDLWGLFNSDWLNTNIIPATVPWALAGAILSVAGVAFAFWARGVLGRNWSGRVTIKEDHELILRGPYAFVRHPIYTGLLTGAIGTALIEGAVYSFLGVLVWAFALWLKLRTEEQFMLHQFGEQYAGYRQRTKALVPFVL